MTNEVTKRYINCVERLKKKGRIKSYRQFALSLDYFPQGLNKILKGERNVTVELILKSSQLYDFSTEYLFHGRGVMFTKEKIDNSILTVVTDDNDIEKIVYVPISAQAGYAGNTTNPIFFQEMFTFSLPGFGFNTSTHRCFDVSGDSMEPSITSNDQLICSFVDPDLWLTNIRNNMVYVIVTTNSVFVKRVSKHPHDYESIILMSDNKFYEPFQLKFNDIKEIWTVKLKLSPFSATPQYNTTISEQTSLIKKLNKTIDKLLDHSKEKTLNK